MKKVALFALVGFIGLTYTSCKKDASTPTENSTQKEQMLGSWNYEKIDVDYYQNDVLLASQSETQNGGIFFANDFTLEIDSLGNKGTDTIYWEYQGTNEFTVEGDTYIIYELTATDFLFGTTNTETDSAGNEDRFEIEITLSR